MPEARDPDVQHYIASIGDDLARCARQATSSTTPASRWSRRRRSSCASRRSSGARTEAFAAFVAAGGEALRHFAIHEALVARYGRNVATGPTICAPNEPDAIAAFATREPRAIDFSMYLQWCAERTARRASPPRRSAHGVALYRDLAVGVESGGAEAWGTERLRHAASVGAPPDLLNTTGQDWGLPPLSPTTLARDAYAAFAALLADNMRDAGALRIDHAMSLMRLFWIPRGGQAGRRRLRHLSVRRSARDRRAARAARACIVIGEDLGTVPAGFRDKMAANNILSYRILLFERDGNGAFLPPDAYPELALATTGTHDLPPLAGWLEGDDIALHERLRPHRRRNAHGRRAKRATSGVAAVTRRAARERRPARRRDPTPRASSSRRTATSPARPPGSSCCRSKMRSANVRPSIFRVRIASIRTGGANCATTSTRSRATAEFERFARALRELRPRA